MLHIPRFARLLIVALLLVVVPSAYFFYPGPGSPSHIHDGLDAGGIDSEHIREKAPVPNMKPEIEEEEPRDWEYGGQAPQQLIKGVNGAGNFDAADPDPDADPVEDAAIKPGHSHVHTNDHDASVADTLAHADVLTGGVIMPKLGNATAKAELGRATWRFLHTMTLRFPDKPTDDDRQALKSFFHLFSRLYPCGECAEHFQKMLKEYPVQTKTRKTASLWLCNLHNIVNERLHKPEFDCLSLDKTYDCGCGNTTSLSAGGAQNTAAIGAA